MKKQEKMTFRDYMKSLPNKRQDAILMLKDECCVTLATVYRWVNGSAVPDRLKRKVIARSLGIPEEYLFPENERHEKA